VSVTLAQGITDCQLQVFITRFCTLTKIDVGIEILPMKSLQAQMSSGPGYYEGELYNVLQQGRGVPAVPLVIIGIDV